MSSRVSGGDASGHAAAAVRLPSVGAGGGHRPGATGPGDTSLKPPASVTNPREGMR